MTQADDEGFPIVSVSTSGSKGVQPFVVDSKGSTSVVSVSTSGSKGVQPVFGKFEVDDNFNVSVSTSGSKGVQRGGSGGSS